MTLQSRFNELRDNAHQLSPAKFAHVVCLTDRLQEMRDWYLTVLNATVAFENEQMCFLRYDDEHHRIGLIRNDDMLASPQGPSRIVDHVAFTYDELPQLFGTYLRLEAAGIVPFWTINHGPTISFYYKDPDGHKIELQVDTFTIEQCEAFFRAGSYLENPIGVNLEPKELIARFLDGEPLESLTRRPQLPRGVSPYDMIRH